MKFQVTLIRADGYTFCNGFEDMAEARAFMAQAAAVLFPGETLKFSTL